MFLLFFLILAKGINNHVFLGVFVLLFFDLGVPGVAQHRDPYFRSVLLITHEGAKEEEELAHSSRANSLNELAEPALVVKARHGPYFAPGLRFVCFLVFFFSDLSSSVEGVSSRGNLALENMK